MSEPEIARRCVACGASIRERALFCPQCGHAVGDETRKLEEGPQTISEPFNPTVPNSQPGLERTIAEPAMPTQPLATQALSEPPRPEHLARQRLHRAAVGAREVQDDVIHRVDQIRKISSVVIDQASYDPSLRFILVAACLFLVFLTILIMSKLIG